MKHMIGNQAMHAERSSSTTLKLHSDMAMLPGLPDDVAKLCLSLVPRTTFPAMRAVSRGWRSFFQSKELITIRKQAGILEEWLYMLTMGNAWNESYWEVLDCIGKKHQVLPPMPGEFKVRCEAVVLHGKLVVMAGYTASGGEAFPSSDVYQYDHCLNCWSKLSNMNVARYDFASAELDGKIYVVGGKGRVFERLSSAEVYDPDTNKWTEIESIPDPRWDCFASGLAGKLYVMDGKNKPSGIEISNSVDVYNPEETTWSGFMSECGMATTHAVLRNKLFLIEWANQREMAIFNPEDYSWKRVRVPLNGRAYAGFKFGILDGKLLLFSEYRSFLYDPEAAPGSEWKTSNIKSPRWCLRCVTIKA